MTSGLPWLTLGLLLIASAPASASVNVGGPVVLEADVEGAEHECPHDVAPVMCPFTADQNGTLDPGDDEVSSSIFIDEARLTVAGTSEESFSFEPSEVVVRHPVNRALNETWPTLNDTRPEPTRQTLAFESRPHRNYQSDGSWNPEEWGVFVTVYFPPPYRVASFDSYPVFSWCWDVCFIDDQTYLQAGEDWIQPFPEDVFLRDYSQEEISTDFHVTHRFYEVGSCAGIPNCPAAPARPTMETLDSAYRASTPNAAFGLQVNRTTVNTTSGGVAPERSASGPSLSSKPGALQAAPVPRRHHSPGVDAVPGFEQGRGPPPAETEQGNGQGSPQPPSSVSSVQVAGPHRGALLLAAAGASTVLLALLWFLYHRIARKDGLDQTTRRRVRDAVLQHPGMRAAEIATHLSLSRNTVKYHLRWLKTWQIVRAEDGSRPRYFPATQSDTDARIHGVLAQPTPRAIHAHLLESGEADHSALAAALGLHLSTVGRAVERLATAGLATRERVGKRVVVRAVPVSSVTSPAKC